LKFLFSVLLDGGVRGGQGDTALVLVADHADVTSLTPGSTPGVLDNPVVLSSGGAITNGEHTVVQVGAAGAREHTRAVELEANLVGLDGDGDRANSSDGVQEGGLIARGDVLVARDGDNLIAGIWQVPSTPL